MEGSNRLVGLFGFVHASSGTFSTGGTNHEPLPEDSCTGAQEASGDGWRGQFANGGGGGGGGGGEEETVNQRPQRTFALDASSGTDSSDAELLLLILPPYGKLLILPPYGKLLILPPYGKWGQ